MNLIEELQWRGLIQDIIPETEEYLNKNSTSGYIGFDPTSDSLHVGSFIQIMLLRHLQRAGHRPIVLVGGATGMIGDPSGRNTEREFLSTEQIQKNIEGQKNQLAKFIDFSSSAKNGAILVNNIDWFKDFTFLNFIRDVGKHISVNYMIAKDSVQNRMENGISFTEFSYQLVQGYDFLHLYRHYNCRLQIGGSDQWGNIVTGTELIRRIDQGKAYAFTTPLITKADGSKFGKSASGEQIWLDAQKTSPFKFYQFWLNRSDEEALMFLKKFTFYTQEQINALSTEHNAAPHLRILQKEIAKELTTLVHSEDDFTQSVEATNLLFGNASIEKMKSLSEQEILEIFEGVPQCKINKSALTNTIDLVSFLTAETQIMSSNNEARRCISENSISINKQKVNVEKLVDLSDLINDKYIIVQQGKKKYFLVIAE
jgi:tyrosyl-tRNA synthetase